jgi:selenocysteine lyase/cysteine desulfurase
VRIKRFATHDRDKNKLRDPRKWLDDAAVVVLSHVLATTGEVLPLDDVCAEARRRNVWVVANGSHAAGMVPLDVHDLGVDTYLASGSGWMLGPRGTALLFVRSDRLKQLVIRHRPIASDAGDDMSAGAVGLDEARELELEPPSASLTAGLAASLEWLGGIGLRTVRDHAAKLAMRIHEGLEPVQGIEVLSSAAAIARCPIVSLRVTRRPNSQVAQWLLENLSMRVRRIDALQLNAVRASTHVVNRPDELDWFVEAIRTLA